MLSGSSSKYLPGADANWCLDGVVLIMRGPSVSSLDLDGVVLIIFGPPSALSRVASRGRASPRERELLRRPSEPLSTL